MKNNNKGFILVELLVVMGLMIIPLFWYYFGGINLNYLKENGVTKAKEICDKDSKISYVGYERQIFGGFGGRVWYMCSIDSIPVDFYVSRRLNNPELQVYSVNQIFTMPNSFDIK